MAVGLIEFDLSVLVNCSIKSTTTTSTTTTTTTTSTTTTKKTHDDSSSSSESSNKNAQNKCVRLAQFLVAEACRRYRVARRTSQDDGMMRPHYGLCDEEIIKWLKQHPVNDPDCVEFVRSKNTELQLILLRLHLEGTGFFRLFQQHQHESVLLPLVPFIASKTSGEFRLEKTFLLLRNKPEVVVGAKACMANDGSCTSITGEEEAPTCATDQIKETEEGHAFIADATMSVLGKRKRPEPHADKEMEESLNNNSN